MNLTSRMRPLTIALLLLLVYALPGSAQDLLQTVYTERVSIASDGSQGNQGSNSADISKEGRFVAFHSYADNLVEGDNNEMDDVFVYDRESETTRRISVASNGTQGNGASEYPSISENGLYVAFNSFATNLVSDDTNGMFDIFVYDMTLNETVRVSVSSDGTQANDNSYHAKISDDGRYVAFDSFATNLVEGDTNGKLDVFLHDRQTHETIRISVSANGMQGDDNSASPSRPVAGSFIAFESLASNLVASDTNGIVDIFLRDLDTGKISRASISTNGTQANNNSRAPCLSANGRFITFLSYASNLVDGDTNERVDIFVRDLGYGITNRISVASDGTQGDSDSFGPVIASGGRYVAFYSYADNLVSGDTNASSDIFLHDQESGETFRVSIANEGTQGNDGSYLPSITNGGDFVAFESMASNLVAEDDNDTSDVFVYGITPWLDFTEWLPLVVK